MLIFLLLVKKTVQYEHWNHKPEDENELKSRCEKNDLSENQSSLITALTPLQGPRRLWELATCCLMYIHTAESGRGRKTIEDGF